MGRIVIVAYVPKAGKEEQLLVAVKKHLQVLQTEQLATDKPAYVMRAGDGTIIEVFEWRSAEAIKRAVPVPPSGHSGPNWRQHAITPHSPSWPSASRCSPSLIRSRSERVHHTIGRPKSGLWTCRMKPSAWR